MVSALAVAILGGCAETSLPEATGKGTIDAINAMPGSPQVTFLIEERFLGGIGYKASLGAQPFDDLSYDFRFQYTEIGETQPITLATQFIDMAADTNYTLVLTGSVAAPALTQWERPEREFDGAETVFEAAFAHLSPALGDVDMYVGITGTAPVLGEERAKLSYGDQVPAIELESDQYEVTLTARDDPATILYKSRDTFFGARISYTITIFDADPSITANISVRLISLGGQLLELPDSNFLPTLRTVHAAFGTVNFDIYRDEDFTAPIFSDLGFGQSTGDVPVDEGIVPFTYTEVGDPTAIVDEESQLITRGLRTSSVVAGEAGGDLSRMLLVDNRRPIDTHAKLRLIHAAFDFQDMDLYLVETGTDITDEAALIRNMMFGFASDFTATVAADYEIILTALDDKTPLLAPIPMSLANGDVVEMIILNTADPLVPDVLITAF
jgi:hypothetical protein